VPRLPQITLRSSSLLHYIVFKVLSYCLTDDRVCALVSVLDYYSEFGRITQF